ncbi:MAG: hypothetical protein ACRDJC_26745 [Thermomicrobiales bacterium]
MDSTVRGLIVYAVLLVVFRISGKRSLATARMSQGLERSSGISIILNQTARSR